MEGKQRERAKAAWMGRLFVFGLAAVLLEQTVPGCGSREAEQTAKRGEPFLVHVAADEGAGSGLIYRLDGEVLEVLTAAHVVEHVRQDEARPRGAEPAEGVTVTFFDGWQVSCAEILFSGTADLALLRIRRDEIPKQRLQSYEAVETDKERFDALRAGDACLAVGVCGLEETACSEGSILDPWIFMEDYGQYMIWAQGEIRPGMSGGGLFDSEGCLMGILSGGSEDGELAAVPYSLVLQFISENF